MNTQPIDPRALKAAENLANEAFFGEDAIPLVARIIQSHFAESVNGKLLEECLPYLNKCLKQMLDDPTVDFWSEDICIQPLITRVENAIKLAQSQPPSMADELAEACVEMLQFIEMRMAHTGCQSVREILQELEHVKGVSEVSTSHHLGCKETSRTVHLDKIRGLISAYKSPNK